MKQFVWYLLGIAMSILGSLLIIVSVPTIILSVGLYRLEVFFKEPRPFLILLSGIGLFFFGGYFAFKQLIIDAIREGLSGMDLYESTEFRPRKKKKR